MKKILSALLILVLLLGVVGCGKNTEKEENKDNGVFSFKYEELEIPLGEKFSREVYGEEVQYSETPTCAFEDMDRTYTYEHYAINTYTKDKEERILSIILLDSTIATKEGLSLGDSLDKLIDIYGEDYQKEDNLYTFTKGKTSIEFIVENDIVTNIEYVYAA